MSGFSIESVLTASNTGLNPRDLHLTSPTKPTDIGRYHSRKLWTWEPDLAWIAGNKLLAYRLLVKGLEREHKGFVPIGLERKHDKAPLGIMFLKRYSREALGNFPVLVPSEHPLRPQTMLVQRQLGELIVQDHLIELADGSILGAKERKFSLWTPFARAPIELLNAFYAIVTEVRQAYPKDGLLVVPMGVMPWTSKSEVAISERIKRYGGTLSFAEYIEQYNREDPEFGDHRVSDSSRIGSIRPLSRLSGRLIDTLGKKFAGTLVGYSPGDFGQIWIFN